MRSLGEIRFRLRQEAANFSLLLRPPDIDLPSWSPLPLLPEPASIVAGLKDSAWAIEVDRLARGVLDNRIPLLGSEFVFSGPIRWRRDWQHNREFPGAPYFRSVPYLDFHRAGDHKFIWELNRHQHFVLLAQAFLLSGRTEFFEALEKHWDHWALENPFQRGINWTSALEVAFRALSWIWVYHLTGDRMTDSFRRRFLTELYRHGCHLQYNLSVYFSPNTHLLGEAVALHALGVLFPDFPRSAQWRRIGAETVQAQLARQVRPDGAHFEQSSYYHIYALDFFLFHYVLAGRPRQFEPVLIRMAEYLDAIQGPARRIFLIGDDDGGRLFHPYGRHDRYGRATLATCSALFHRPEWLTEREDLYPQAAWWLGAAAFDADAAAPVPRESRLFPDSGTAVSESSSLFVVTDAGGFGPFRAGHSHSDTLSIAVRRGENDILIDPGTFNYADSESRNWFRGSSAHNTIRVDALDQARPLGPFAWAGKPLVSIQEWISTAEWDYLDAACRYDGQPILHRRRLLIRKNLGWVIILDRIEGTGEHLVEQFWHSACPMSRLTNHAYQLGDQARLLLDPTMEVEMKEGWRSPAYGVKLPSQVAVARKKTRLPFTLAAALIGPADDFSPLRVVSDAGISIGAFVFDFPPRSEPS